MNLKNIELTGNQEFNIGGEGSYIYVVNASAPVQVRAKGVNVILKAGQGVQSVSSFKGVDVKNTIASANEIDIVIGHGEFLNSEFSGKVESTAVQAETITSAAVAVTNAATQIIAQDVTRKFAMIQNNSAVDMFIGGAGVTVATGLKLPAGSIFTIDMAAASAWFGIVAAGSENARAISGV